MGNYFSYKRISTKEERQLQKYNRQQKALQKYAKENNIEYIAEFQEDASGKNFTDRKQWQRLEKLVQNGDTVIFKDISRFTRESENGYNKYMWLLNNGINLVFLDNPTISTDYIKQLLNVAEQQNLVAKTALQSTVKLLLIVELDRVEQERAITIKRIKDGISASPNKSGRPFGKLDKISDELKKDINEYLINRDIKAIDLLNKYNISRPTFKKYVDVVKKENTLN